MLSANLKIFKPSPFKSFDDYSDIKEMHPSDLEHGHARYTALENKPSDEANPNYEDTWFLLMREGLYRAQVEKAMSEIYRYFMTVSTFIEIVKKEDDYYAASRGIRNFKEWSFYKGKIELQEDGALVCIGSEGKTKPVIGLAQMCVLSKFFLDTDVHSGQFGLQERDDTFYVVKIDNEKALDIDIDDDEIEDDFETYLASASAIDITQAASFQEEKMNILQKLAATDFSVIESILRNNITSNKLESIKWQLKHLQKYSKEQNQEMLTENLQKVDKLSPDEYEVDAVIYSLRESHKTIILEGSKPASASFQI